MDNQSFPLMPYVTAVKMQVTQRTELKWKVTIYKKCQYLKIGDKSLSHDACILA
jgi:hypothetical protein